MSVNSHHTPYRPAAVAAESRLSNGHREGLVAARPEFRPDYLPDFIPYDGLFYNFTTQSFAR